jgi:hypothetical protein
MLCVIMLNVKMPSATISYRYSDCCYAECHIFALLWLNFVMLDAVVLNIIIIIISVAFLFYAAKPRLSYCYAEFRYDECHLC